MGGGVALGVPQNFPGLRSLIFYSGALRCKEASRLSAARP